MAELKLSESLELELKKGVSHLMSTGSESIEWVQLLPRQGRERQRLRAGQWGSVLHTRVERQKEKRGRKIKGKILK